MNSALISSLGLQSFARTYPTARLLAIRWNDNVFSSRSVLMLVSLTFDIFYNLFVRFTPSIVFFENVAPICTRLSSASVQ